MRARAIHIAELVFHARIRLAGKGDIRCETADDPVIERDTDQGRLEAGRRRAPLHPLAAEPAQRTVHLVHVAATEQTHVHQERIEVVEIAAEAVA